MMQDKGDMDIEDERLYALDDDMEDARRRTLDSLDNFMQTQRILFKRTQADIERLRELQRKASADPINTFRSFSQQPSSSSLPNGPAENPPSPSVDDLLGPLNYRSIQDLAAEVRRHGKDSIIPHIDWRLFANGDPTKLREMTAAIRNAHPSSVYPTPLPPPRPPPRIPSPETVSTMEVMYPPPMPPSSSKESDLQRLVRTQRKLIIEPALEASAAFLATFTDSEEEASPLTATRGKGGAARNGRKSKKKARDQNKANNRRRRSGASGVNCGLTINRPRGPGGVFIKRDAEGVVDADAIDNASLLGSPLPLPTPVSTTAPRSQRRKISSSSMSMDIDPLSMDLGPIAVSKPLRTRRPSTRLLDGYGPPPSAVSHETRASVVAESPASVPPTPLEPSFPEQREVIKLKIRIPPRKFDPDRGNSNNLGSSRMHMHDIDMSQSQSTRSASCSVSTPMDDVSDSELTSDGDRGGDDDDGEEELSGAEDDDDDGMQPGVRRNSTRVIKKSRNGDATTVHVGKAKNGKPKPETFNIPWSIEEQHLLERLLDEIPDGELKRWAKISQRMDGRRTPRQVASRVQKYTQKLKKFGLT